MTLEMSLAEIAFGDRFRGSVLRPSCRVNAPDLFLESGAITDRDIVYAMHQDIGQSSAKSGIMRASWNQWDFQNAQQGALLFTSEQAAKIRGTIERL